MYIKMNANAVTVKINHSFSAKLKKIYNKITTHSTIIAFIIIRHVSNLVSRLNIQAPMLMIDRIIDTKRQGNQINT